MKRACTTTAPATTPPGLADGPHQTQQVSPTALTSIATAATAPSHYTTQTAKNPRPQATKTAPSTSSPASTPPAGSTSNSASNSKAPPVNASSTKPAAEPRTQRRSLKT